MNTEENFFGDSKQKVEEYVKDRLLLLKLEAVEKVSKLAGALSAGLLVALFAFFVLLFVSIMAGYLIGELLNHVFWGFAIVAGLYIILLVLIIIYRKSIIEKRVINLVIDIFFEKSKHEIKEDNNEQQH